MIIKKTHKSKRYKPYGRCFETESEFLRWYLDRNKAEQGNIWEVVANCEHAL